MTLKHLLVHVDSTAAAAGRISLGVALASRFGARLTGLFAESESLGTSIVGRRSAEQVREAAGLARDDFAARAAAGGVDGEWWSLGQEGHGELLGLTAACCRYADLALFGPPAAGQGRVPPDLLERVLGDCGRPVLVVPAGGWEREAGRRVVVAWNASRAAARAVNDALPFLEAAEAVTVLAFQADVGGPENPMPRASIVDHLALHGVRAAYQRAVQGEGGMTVADSLLNCAFEAKADLVVAGALPAAPFRHGGFTARELLASMTTPVLLAT